MINYNSHKKLQKFAQKQEGIPYKLTINFKPRKLWCRQT